MILISGIRIELEFITEKRAFETRIEPSSLNSVCSESSNGWRESSIDESKGAEK